MTETVIKYKFSLSELQSLMGKMWAFEKVVSFHELIRPKLIDY